MTDESLAAALASYRAAALAAGCTEAELDAPPTCFGGCGLVVARVAETCPACKERRRVADHDAAVLRAWHTVPGTMQWIRLRDQPNKRSIREWAREAISLEHTRQLADDLTKHPLVTFVGAQAAGKTTLAVGLLAEWIAPGWYATAPPAARSWSRRCRYAFAEGLLADRSETPLGEVVTSVDLAARASTLLLDEVGRGTADPQQVMFRLLHERHRERRPTIITTPCTSAAALATATGGDGGLARRVFDDAVVIEVGTGKGRRPKR